MLLSLKQMRVAVATLSLQPAWHVLLTGQAPPFSNPASPSITEMFVSNTLQASSTSQLWHGKVACYMARACSGWLCAWPRRGVE